MFHQRGQISEIIQADLEEEITFHVFITQLNMEMITTSLLDISNPLSINYGQHWDGQQLIKTIDNKEGKDKVIKYLNTFCSEVKLLAGGQIYQSKAKLGLINHHLKTKLFMFNHDGNSYYRSESLEYPIHLDDHISYIGGITDDLIEPIRDKPVKRSSGNTYNGILDPLKLQKYYNVPPTADAVGTTGVVLNFDLDFIKPTVYSLYDLAIMLTYYIPIEELEKSKQILVPDYNFSADHDRLTYEYLNQGLLGPYDYDITSSGRICRSLSISGCDSESTLDIQYLQAVNNVTFDLVITPRSGTLSGFGPIIQLDFLLYLINNYVDYYPSLKYTVISISYSWDASSELLELFCNRVKQLGLVGTTVLMSSGDNGYSGNLDPTSCQTPQMPEFNFCPYLTSVGATMGPESNLNEVVCSSCYAGKEESLITSGGGFSNYFYRPSYQSEAIDKYLEDSTNYPPIEFNSYRRAIPDISLAGNSYQILLNGINITADGTSASSPALASVIGMVNSARKKNGKPAMGFLNPFLYMYYRNFTRDITEGDNRCKSNSLNRCSNCCPNGFKATVGWDAATGLGSIDVAKFISTASNYSSPTNSEISTTEALGVLAIVGIVLLSCCCCLCICCIICSTVIVTIFVLAICISGISGVMGLLGIGSTTTGIVLTVKSKKGNNISANFKEEEVSYDQGTI